MIKIPSQIRLKTEFFEGYGIEELVKTIIVLCIAVVIGYIIYLFTKITLISTFFVIGSVVIPINTDLFSEEELENKMDSMSIEFSNEQYPYTILVIPRKVDIADFINEQQELKRKLQDDVTIQIVEKRIICTHELVADKNIIENEFYLCIWTKDGENAIENLIKRANNWKQRFIIWIVWKESNY